MKLGTVVNNLPLVRKSPNRFVPQRPSKLSAAEERVSGAPRIVTGRIKRFATVSYGESHPIILKPIPSNLGLLL